MWEPRSEDQDRHNPESVPKFAAVQFSAFSSCSISKDLADRDLAGSNPEPTHQCSLGPLQTPLNSKLFNINSGAM